VEYDLAARTSTTSAYWNERRLSCQQYYLPRTQTTCLIRRLGRRRTVTSSWSVSIPKISTSSISSYILWRILDIDKV
jgi:hypothetical protein